MMTQYHWQRGPIGCCQSASRLQSIAAAGSAGGKGFVSSLDCSVSASPSRRSRFQATRRAAPHGSSPQRLGRTGDWYKSLGYKSLGYKSLGETVCHGAMIPPHFADMDSDSDRLQGFPLFALVPLAAAVALALCRATSLMASWTERAHDRVRRVIGGENASDDAPLVDEFTQAAKGGLPWRPGLEKALRQQGGISLALLSATAIAHDHLNPIIATLRANPTFMSGLIAWALAQIAKVFTYYMVVRKWDFRMVMGSGGMPSSHSALCFALTTSVAFVHGVSDGLFPVCLGFTLIVMYDAAGVRRHAGRQAEVLNMIVADLFQGHPISDRKLKELLGHTPLQVFAGAALGIIVGYLCSRPRLA